MKESAYLAAVEQRCQIFGQLGLEDDYLQVPATLKILRENDAALEKMVEALDPSLSAGSDIHTALLLLLVDVGLEKNLSGQDAISVWKEVFKVQFEQSALRGPKLQAFIEQAVGLAAHAYRLEVLKLLLAVQTDPHAPLTSAAVDELAKSLSADADPAISRTIQVLSKQSKTLSKMAQRFGLVPDVIVRLALNELRSSTLLDDDKAVALWCSWGELFGISQEGLSDKLTFAAQVLCRERAMDIMAQALRDKTVPSTYEAVPLAITETAKQLGARGIPGSTLQLVEKLRGNLEFSDSLSAMVARVLPFNKRSRWARAAVLLGCIEMIPDADMQSYHLADDKVAKLWQEAYNSLPESKGGPTQHTIIYDSLEQLRLQLAYTLAMQRVFAADQCGNLLGKSTDLLATVTTNDPALVAEILGDVDTYKDQAVDLLAQLSPHRSLHRIMGVERAVLLAAISNFFGSYARGAQDRPQIVGEWVNVCGCFSATRALGFVNGVLDKARVQITSGEYQKSVDEAAKLAASESVKFVPQTLSGHENLLPFPRY